MSFLQKLGSLFRNQTDNSPAVATPVSDARQITLTRVYDSNRQKVWEMWTRPDKLAQWWGSPPLAATKESTQIDLRVGGRWQADMVNASDGTTIPFRGTYLEIIPPQKLVFTIENPQDPNDKNVETVTVTFTDHAGTTQMTMRQEGHLPAEQYGEPLRNGYSAFFERMAKYLRIHVD